MKLSQLKIHSIGTVVSNKPLNTNIIDVLLIEDQPMADGELTAATNTDSVDSEGADGSTYNVQLKSRLNVKAEWLPHGSSNRHTSPDVRRGAQVVIYRFADADKYYWTTLKDDLALRKLETVIYAWSGTKDESDTVTADTFYYLEMSTHKGLVHFHSTKKNGEPFAYDFQINTKDGFFTFQDDAGQKVTVDSKERQIVMTNSDGCSIFIDKLNMTINVPETFTLVAKNVVENISETLKTSASNSITTQTKTHNVNATSLTEKATDITITGSATVTIDGGSVQIN